MPLPSRILSIGATPYRKVSKNGFRYRKGKTYAVHSESDKLKRPVVSLAKKKTIAPIKIQTMNFKQNEKQFIN